MEQIWETRQHPEGFTLEVPADWETRFADGRINAAGKNMERVTILPFHVEAQLDAGGARDLLLALSRQFWPEQRWEMPRGGWQFNQNSVGAAGANEGAQREITVLWWTNTNTGAHAFFYALAAPHARFQSLQTDFARILGSFRVTGGGGHSQAPAHPLEGMQFQTWTDPTEMAFSLEVPVGWRVFGGISRQSGVAMSEYIVQSPDGQVSVRSGDVNFPSKYTAPNMTLASLGTWEGQYASGGYLVLNFKPALDFAVYYTENTVGRNCQNLQWLGGRDRPDRVQALSWYWQALGFPVYTAAELTYTCQFGGRPFVGYLYTETAITHHSHVATLWNPQALYGFIAPPDRTRLADAVLFHTIATFQTNPQWMAMQGRINQQQAADLRRYHEHSMQLWQQTQAERWASWDRISEQRGDVLLGQTQVVDPETRQVYKVQSGSSYYWLDPTRDVIAGTDIPYKPDWDFRRLIETYY